MIITNIITLQKKKVLIELDGHLVFPLYTTEVRKYHIVLEQELPEELFNELFGEVLPKRAKLRAMHLLTKRSYTEQVLRTKLEEGGYPDEIVEQAMTYVKSYGYIDDQKYVEDYISTYDSSKSKMKMQQDLYRKGISKQIFEDIWEEQALSETEDCELEQIQKLIAKKKFCYENATLKERQNVIQFLFRKGYPLEKITRCIQMEDIF